MASIKCFLKKRSTSLECRTKSSEMSEAILYRDELCLLAAQGQLRGVLSTFWKYNYIVFTVMFLLL